MVILLVNGLLQPDSTGMLKSELKEKVLTDKNKQKAKRGLKIAVIIFGIIVLIDVISMIVL